MYLKTLTLRGFKSFASATRFELEPGVTCVVGPNGSGKSNVVDALAWVMGEQGAKTLRGGKMEDVIFAGTTGRPPLGRAEVSLTIDNSDGALPIEYSEVTITRTLFRNGGSEYAINGAACRLLDIQDLLSDSGLGREMHVIVGQGQLDQILRATPLERRGFIEEAAGVLKHRKRKEKALRKLDNMQGNLLRLTDLIAELRRQLGPLGKQAQAARKAAVIAAQVRDSGLRLLADDLNTELNKQGDLSRSLDSLRLTVNELNAHCDVLRTRLVSLEEAAAGVSPKAQRAADIVMELSGQREQLRSISQIAVERQRHLGSAAVPVVRNSHEVAEQLLRAQKALEECAVEVAAVKSRLSDGELERQRTHEAHAKLVRKREQMRESRAAHREKVAQLGAQVASQRARVEAISQSYERLTTDLADANTRHAEASRELDTIEGHNTVQTVGESSFDESSFEALKARELELTETLESFGREQGSVREAYLEVERLGATHKARAIALNEAVEKALGSARKLTESDPGLVPFGQYLDVAQEHEKAVLAALTQLRHSVVAHSLEQAVQASHTATELGLAAAVIAHPAIGDAGTGADIALPEGAIRAISVVKLPEHNHALFGLLGRVVLASASLARTILELDSTLVVATPHGEVFASEWVVSPAQEDHIFGSQREAEVEQKRYEQLRNDSAVLAARVKELDGLVAQHQANLKTLRTQISAAQEQQRLAEAANARVQALKDAALKETARLEQQRQEVAARKNVEEQKLVDLVTQYETLLQRGSVGAAQDTGDQTAEGVEADIARAAISLERTREVETLARLDLRSAQEKHKNLENRVAGIQRTLRQEQAAEQAAAEAAQKRAEAAQRITTVLERTQSALVLIERSIARATHERDDASAQRDRLSVELVELRSALSVRDAEQRDLTSNIHVKELDLATITGRLQQFETRAINDFGMSPADVVEQYGPHLEIPVYDLPKAKVSIDQELTAPDLAGAQAYDREYLEKSHERAQKALAGLGKVNPLALEEFTALEERHKYLSDQLADLKQSRADLLNLVDDIDARVQEVFASAFEDTASQFSQVFPRLFPGGEGRMFLTEPDDLLNTGIDIEARPAGKKVKRLSLLSGGERSLTAIAMLVSIFKARPSPFYVMDEVEAALDDVNLGRLLGVFKELQEDSQLIVITHQKRTMEIADALYGVTMQGDGVSAVLSQRLEKAAT